jgi:guanylate kinase
MKIYTTDDLLHLIIRGNHGSAVSEQFSDTWNGDDVEEQNPTAMEYIKETMHDLIAGEFFSDSVNENIKEYLNRLQTVNDDEDDNIDDEFYSREEEINYGVEDDERPVPDEMNEAIQKIKSDFKRFL